MRLAEPLVGLVLLRSLFFLSRDGPWSRRALHGQETKQAAMNGASCHDESSSAVGSQSLWPGRFPWQQHDSQSTCYTAQHSTARCLRHCSRGHMADRYEIAGSTPARMGQLKQPLSTHRGVCSDIESTCTVRVICLTDNVGSHHLAASSWRSSGVLCV